MRVGLRRVVRPLGKSTDQPLSHRLASSAPFADCTYFDIDEPERECYLANCVFGYGGWHLRCLLGPRYPHRCIGPERLPQNGQAFDKVFLLRDEDVRNVDALARLSFEHDTCGQWLDKVLVVLRRIDKENARRLRDAQLLGKGSPGVAGGALHAA